MKGEKALIQFSLAIFSKYQKDLLVMDADEIGYFLKTQLSSISDHEVKRSELIISLIAITI